MQMKRVAGGEAIAPVVEGEPELRRTRRRLGKSADRLKAEVGAAHQHGRPLRMSWRSDFAIRAIIGNIDPIVHAEPGIGDAMLRVLQAESGVEHLADVGLAVAIGVLKVKDLGRCRDDQSTLPGH